MRLILITTILCSCQLIYSQDDSFGTKVKEQAKTSTENKTLNEVDKTVNNTFDKAEEGVINIFKKKDKKSKTQPQEPDNNKSSDTQVNPSPNNTTNSPKSNDVALSYKSKFDFISGEKIIITEDFMQDNVGDFPDKWNTNSSAEIVTLSNTGGHWLMIHKKGRFIPEYINSLPDNFTYEFDLVCSENFNYYSPLLDVYFVTGKNNNTALNYSFIQIDKRSGVKIGFHPHNAANTGGGFKVETYDDGQTIISNESITTQFNALKKEKNKVHIAVWRQKSRLRVYVNEDKVADLPKAFTQGKTYTTNLFDLWSDMSNDNDKYFISNIKLAVGAPDTRNKLLTEGKFVTTGILFDIGSDKLKPESYGVIKEIANILSENTNIKIKIVGHTDSDGNDNTNMELSKKRAESVKQSLIKDFNIESTRIETDGKGETQPIAPNDTPVNKAQNRRVEFIKL